MVQSVTSIDPVDASRGNHGMKGWGLGQSSSGADVSRRRTQSVEPVQNYET